MKPCKKCGNALPNSATHCDRCGLNADDINPKPWAGPDNYERSEESPAESSALDVVGYLLIGAIPLILLVVGYAAGGRNGMIFILVMIGIFKLALTS